MDNNEQAKLLTALQKGTVQVTFRKIDTGEIRVMPCTLNPTVLKANGVTTDINFTQMEWNTFQYGH